MSLVPILYTSLIVFGILVIVIVSSSYVAYKMRSRVDELEKEEEVYHYVTQPDSNQLKTNRYREGKIKVVSNIKNPETKKTLTLPLRKRTEVINKNKINTMKKESKDESNKKLNNSKSSQKRLEVINKKVQPSINKEENLEISGSGSIALSRNSSNLDMFNYYTDDEESGYFYKPNRYFQ